MCEVCKESVSLFSSRRWDVYISEYDKNLEICCNYESDNKISLEINYCPVCGEKLR